MPKPRKSEMTYGQFFRWRLIQRPNGVWYADARSTFCDLGRHSLGTRDQKQALTQLRRLDQKVAINRGLTGPTAAAQEQNAQLSLAEGIENYMTYLARPAVARGASQSTIKRYHAIFDKFTAFAAKRGVAFWTQVTAKVITSYAAWLDDNGYEYATAYLELTTLKQALRYLVRKAKLLPESCIIDLPLGKPEGTTTFCFDAAQVSAIVQRCFTEPKLRWLGEVIVGLAHSGLRIGELIPLRWTDFDADLAFLQLPDHSRRGTAKDRAGARTTKGRYERVLPTHPTWRETLLTMKRCPDGRLYHGPNGGQLKADTVRIILKREVLKPLAARFPSPPGEKGFTSGKLHSFRHYFCSVCANANVPEEMLMVWLGHKNSAMVKRYYHAHRDEAQRRMNAIKFSDPPTAT